MGLCTSVTANEDRREKKTREGGAEGEEGGRGIVDFHMSLKKIPFYWSLLFFSAEYFLAS